MTHTAPQAGALPPWSGPYPPWGVVPPVITAAFVLATCALLLFALWQRTRTK